MRFTSDKLTPKKCLCDCPEIKQTNYAEWASKSCECCEHQEATSGWERSRWCKDRCFMSRFPMSLWAKLSLLQCVIVHVPYGIMTPMGGTITTRPELSVAYFDKYMFFAGIDDRERQRKIFEDLRELLVLSEKYREGNGVFQQEEHCPAVIAMSE